ncbi:hypothetical protein IFM89_014685 [Coptis chinensis]|uniref:Uncharacterized protein n=1 Tax=Coptis chinensis TaxID=261450 RepID=A0A835HBR0_9MAGN|nr:hypothetical protein IFM89_014685 [Coptis chinensis]
MAHLLVNIVALLAILVVIAEAKNPGYATCTVKKYKNCYDTVHVCPKLCPYSCTVDCASCQPICSLSPPPPKQKSPPPPKYKSPPPPKYKSPPPPPKYKSPPPPKYKSPPPPPKYKSPPPPKYKSPPPPPKYKSPPPPKYKSPPPPPKYKSPPPPKYKSPPPPPKYKSPPPPKYKSPPPPPKHKSPPPPKYKSPPPPPTPKTPPVYYTPPPHSYAPPPPPAKCDDPSYTHCFNTEHVCPSSCTGGCEVDCHSCKPICKCDKPGSVCQDPKFIGGDGITFYFHGKKDQDFCLLSDSNLHINGHFIGRRNSNMKRDFTWVQSIGLLFDNHQIFVGAQKTSTWEDSVDRLALSFDGEPIFLPESEGAKWQSEMTPGITFTRSRETNSIVVEVEGKFKITATVVPITEQDSIVHNYGITKEDCFAHLDLGFKFYELSDEVNGVLGKTYRRDYVSKVKMGVSMPIMGGNKEFSSSGLFATDCKVARFGGVAVGVASETGEYASLSCESGMDGRGVVCKR